MSKLKVLLLTIYNYPHPGGISSHLNALKDGLENLKNKVEIFSADSLSKFLILFLRILYFLRKLNHAIFYFIYLKSLKLFFEIYTFGNYLKNKWNIIHAQDPIALNCTKLIRFFFDPKLILTLHGFLTEETLVNLGSKNTFLHNLLMNEEITAYLKAERIVTIEKSRKEHIIKLIKKPKKIFVHKNFVNLTSFKKFHSVYFLKKFSLPKKASIILFPKRLVKSSGVQYFIEAAIEILKKRRNYFFVILGKGYLFKKIRKLIKNQKNIIYHKPVPYSLMPYLLNSTNVVVIPSISIGSTKEGSSMAIIESMACGIPIIASAVGGNLKLIESGRTGLLIPEKNSEAIVKAIIKLSRDTDLWNKISINSQIYVEKNFSHLKAAKFFQRIYLL